MTKIDDLDEKILAILRENARAPLSEVAKRINRSRTAVQARVQKLEDAGVILGYTVREASGTSGRVGALVTVYLHERLDPKDVVDTLQKFPEVLFCYRVSGDADLLVELSESTGERIQEICEVLWGHENVRLTETVFVLGTLLDN